MKIKSDYNKDKKTGWSAITIEGVEVSTVCWSIHETLQYRRRSEPWCDTEDLDMVPEHAETRTHRHAYIDRVDTMPAYRGHGYARVALVEAIESICEVEDDNIPIYVVPEPGDKSTSREGLIEFYTSLGLIIQ